MTDLDLTCPQCDHPLNPASLEPGALSCGACSVTYPSLSGIPWLFAEPDAAWAEWRTRIDYATKHHQKIVLDAGRALDRNPSTAARRRLEHLASAHERQLKALGALLSPLIDRPVAGNLETHLALKTRLPTGQGLTSYSANLYRDWVWGDDENRISFDMVAQAFGDLTGARLLALGAGAGRLAYDLHQQLMPATTAALDLNPLLMLVLQAVSRGDTVELTEFPLAPRRSEDSAVNRRLAAPTQARPGFHPILANALRAPFLPSSFDAVLTPWFVDIVETPLAETTAHINSLLREGGVWVNFGSLAFTGNDVTEALSFEEVLETIANSGFEVTVSDEVDVPYMNCPNSRHGRRESVVALRAEKRKPVKRPARHQSLPDWLVGGTTPIPMTPAFQSQAATTRIYAFIMSMIDGKRSIREMALLMEEQRLMQRREAEVALRRFFTTMLDESRSAPGL